jgi:hypothetical protein
MTTFDLITALRLARELDETQAASRARYAAAEQSRAADHSRAPARSDESHHARDPEETVKTLTLATARAGSKKE